jgi:hypothetical protein
MIRNMHFLAALPSDTGPLSVSFKKGEGPIEGLRVYFSSGHINRIHKVAYWLTRLTSDPLPWVRPSEDHWEIDLAEAKLACEVEAAKSWPYKAELSWPSWLTGTILMAPDFETEAGAPPRLAFYVTHLAVARQRNPARSSASDPLVLNQFFAGDIKMSSDQFNISNVSGQIGAIGTANQISASTLTNATSNVDAAHDLSALASELASLRAEMRRVGTDIQHDQALVSVGAAEKSAKNGDAAGVTAHLKAAGKWALDTATKIGVQVAAKALERAIASDA